MNQIALPFGKVLKGVVLNPIKAASDYTKIKIALRKYEKQTDVVPLKKLKRKVYKSNKYFVDLTQEISNPMIKVLKANSSNTTDVYYDNDSIVLSCSYNVAQNLLNKNTTMICNCVDTKAVANSAYYYLACCIKYNVATDHTENMLTVLNSKIR